MWPDVSSSLPLGGPRLGDRGTPPWQLRCSPTDLPRSPPSSRPRSCPCRGQKSESAAKSLSRSHTAVKIYADFLTRTTNRIHASCGPHGPGKACSLAVETALPSSIVPGFITKVTVLQGCITKTILGPPPCEAGPCKDQPAGAGYLCMRIQDEVSNQGHVLLQDLAGQISGTHEDGLRPILAAEVHHPLDIRGLQCPTWSGNVPK